MVVEGLRHIKKGLISGMGHSDQMNTQSAAVTEVTYTASGAIKPADNVVDLNTASGAIIMTIAADGFDVGRILVITQVDAGTDGHTVTLTPTGATFDKTNNTATFNAQYEALVLLCISPKRFLILKNYGSVALSAV